MHWLGHSLSAYFKKCPVGGQIWKKGWYSWRKATKLKYALQKGLSLGGQIVLSGWASHRDGWAIAHPATKLKYALLE